jgi:putative Ca2+/H+ antiporter (TMEM165/GDT1 family)
MHERSSIHPGASLNSQGTEDSAVFGGCVVGDAALAMGGQPGRRAMRLLRGAVQPSTTLMRSLQMYLLVAVCGLTICEMVYGGDLEAAEIKRMAEAQAEGGALEMPSMGGGSLQQSGDGKDFSSSFTASFIMILACEVGDKTFFIAMILALRNGRAVIFSGAILALAVMTVMGVGLGWVLPLLMPVIYTHYASVVLFFYFGFVLLKEAYESDGDDGFEELEEVEAELAEDSDVEAQKGNKKNGFVNLMEALFTPVLIKAFTMTFVAEWGDRSQIATIALAAQKEPFGVIFGGIAGHCICTGCAVMFGQMISTKISERSVAIVGGVVFLGFGVYNLVSGPDDSMDKAAAAGVATPGDATTGEFLAPPSIPDRRLLFDY